MEKSSDDKQPLRTGLTTGACATACATAAAHYLLSSDDLSVSSHFPNPVSITLPKGKTVELCVAIEQANNTPHHASITVTTIKDAGDDPDVTHGATVFVELQLIQNVIEFAAAKGKGTATKQA